MELQGLELLRGTNLSLFLQENDRIDEGSIGPRRGSSASLGCRNNSGGSFFDNTETFKLQLADNGRLARAGCPGDDEPAHTPCAPGSLSSLLQASHPEE